MTSTGKFSEAEDDAYLDLLNKHGQPKKGNATAELAFQNAFASRKMQSIKAHVNAFHFTGSTWQKVGRPQPSKGEKRAAAGAPGDTAADPIDVDEANDDDNVDDSDASDAPGVPTPPSKKSKGKYSDEEDVTYLRLLNQFGQPKNDKTVAEKAAGNGTASVAAFQNAFPTRSINSIKAHINAFHQVAGGTWQKI